MTTHAQDLEKVVNEALGDVLREAESLLVTRLGNISLAELARSFDVRCKIAHTGKRK